MWMTRTTSGCSAASRSSRAGVPSVEPSSTKIASIAPAGMVCPRIEAMAGSMDSPGSNTGTMTLTRGADPVT